ncbi:MAG TPA: carbohydrate ABC transporter permease [Anaerolineae bacterium]|nr:carbohydrate ABC transporter permease [Anaerolineae bacterium]
MTAQPVRKSFRRSRLLIYLFLIGAAAVFLLPVYVLVVTGFKSFQEVSLATMWNPPSAFSLASFQKAWSGSEAEGFRGLAGNFLNSVYLAVPATLLSAILGSINGYILSKWKFRGADTLFSLMLFGMFIPYQSVLIPLVQVLQQLSRVTGPIAEAIASMSVPAALSGLPPWLAGFVPAYGTIGGLILVHVIYGIPITTLIFRNYYTAVPTELVEAAKLDGASLLGIYRWVLFPISMPGFVVVLIWQFTSIWNDFLFGVIVTSRPAVQPVTVALNNLAGSYIVEWNVQMAGAFLTALPTLLVYILLGRFFMRGLLAGSLKG